MEESIKNKPKGGIPVKKLFAALIALILALSSSAFASENITAGEDDLHLDCMTIIKKHSKDFGGSLEDPDVMKLCGCSRNSYYKYKKDAKESGTT